jgi:uncharacterized membrane protein (UPF0127 family)
MIKFGKIFNLSWKTALVISVFFVTFTSTNILISSWKDILASEQLQNFIYGGKFLVIGDAKLKILLAETEEKRILGLSGRKSLEENQAMLFVFPENGNHGIWMKDMSFDIDVIWLDSKFQVVDFIEEVTPASYPNVFKPKKPAKYVLETNSGFIKANGIKIDDQATFLD